MALSPVSPAPSRSVLIIFDSKVHFNSSLGERCGLVVNASDSGSRGWGFEPHSGQTVLCP